MMLKEIIEKIEFDKISFFESDTKVEIMISGASNLNLQNSFLLKSFFSVPSKTDELKLNVSCYGEMEKNINIENIHDVMNYLHDLQLTENLSIHIDIYKTIVNNVLNIYCIDEYMNYINSDLNEIKFLKKFSNLLENRNYIILNTMDNKVYMYSNSIYIGDANLFNGRNKLIRLKRISMLSEFKNLNASFEVYLLPEDFDIEFYDVEEKVECLKNKFDIQKILLSMIYISDYSSLFDDRLEYSISGKNTIYNFIIDNDAYFILYNWIFENNFYEKLILSKNIIGMLNFDISNFSIVEFKIILSNYRLLQKENIQMYLDLKSNISSNIIQSSIKISNIIKDTREVFLKNLFAFLSFIFTVIIINVASSSQLNNVFSPDMIKIIYFLLVASYVVLLVNSILNKSEINRLKKTYQMMKRNYEDVFVDELDNIFHNDIDFKSSIEETKKIIFIIQLIWFLSITLVLLLLEFVLGYGYISYIINQLIKLIFK